MSLSLTAEMVEKLLANWSGRDPDKEWTPEELKVMADRLEQTDNVLPILRELIEHGGVKIS